MLLRFLPLLALSPALAWAVDPLAIHNPALIGAERAAYFDASAFAGNDVMPLRELAKSNSHWQEGYNPKNGKNLAIGSLRVESGVEWAGFRLGYVARQEWVVNAEKDSLDIYRMSKSKTLDAGRSYAIGYQLEGFSAQGVQLAKAFAFDLAPEWKMAAGASLSWLAGDRLRRENWQGAASALPSGNLSVNASISRDDTQLSKDLFRDPINGGAAGQGSGYAVDVGVSVVRADGWRLDYAVSDLAAEMKWKDVPGETLTGNAYIICPNINAPSCSDDKINHANSASLAHRRSDVTYRPVMKQVVTLSAPVNKAFVELGDTVREGEHFPRIGIRQQENKDWQTRIDYDFRFHSVGLALAHRWLVVNLQSDAFDPSKAKAFGLGLGVRIPF